jgi:hypothetical protein
MIRTRQLPSVQLWTVSDVFYVAAPVANVSAANAILAPVILPRPLWGGGALWWPMIQVSAHFTAGVTYTDNLIVHVRDAQTGLWDSLATLSLVGVAGVTPTAGQVMQFEMPPGKDSIGLEHALGNAADRPEIAFRMLASVSVPVVLE